MAVGSERYFHAADYAVFAASLLLSSSVGVYYWFRDRRASRRAPAVATTDSYMMAGRRMPVLPVSLSLFVSWLSSITFLGDPVEVYYYGSIYVFLGVGYALAIPVVASCFVPRLHRLKATSAYQVSTAF